MNLWVRTLRQLTVVAVALFFFSCEDEAGLLGFKNPNKKIHVGSVDIPLGVTSVLTIDSLVTDLRPIVVNNQLQFVDGILVGQYEDPDFGKITTQSFLSVDPIGDAALAATAVFDSITLQLRLNFSAYGFSGNKQQRFAIHELIGDTLSLYGGNNYYASSPAPLFSAEPLGETVITVNYDSLKKEAVSSSQQQDTLLMSGRLSDDFGTRVFNAIKGGFPDDATRKLFRSQIKGLAILPGTEPGILGMNVVNEFGQYSRVIIHYHTLTEEGAVDDTLSRSLGFEYASFTKIDADRTTTELAALQPYASVEPASGLRYIQSGAPLVTKIDLSPFYSFADTVENIMINEAELLIDNVTGSPGMEPHNSLLLRLLNNNTDQFLNNHMAADRELAGPYYVNSSTNDYYYFAANESAGPATITYDDENDRFSGYMTLFAQSLFANKKDGDGINENRLRYVALYPASPSATRGISRTLFQKENLTLRVVYTRANAVNP